MVTEQHQECPNCDDSDLDVQVLEEKHDEHLGLLARQCRWICLNCGWASQQWWATN